MCVDWQPLETLRAFARERNEFQRGEHIVDFTMYDVFKNLKQSADVVAVREGLTEGGSTNRGHIKRVADHYCGGLDTANNLTRQLAGIAVVLSWPVIEEMGKMLNKEDLDAAKQAAKNTEEVTVECIDARVCNLFTKSTLRGATMFKSMASEGDQINVIRRLSFLAPRRSYRPISKAELESQTKKTMAAAKEVEKMKKKFGGHAWPADMISVRNTLLTTTTLDGAVEENEGKYALLPVFQGLWERLFPINAELENAKDETQNPVSRDSSDFNHISDCAESEFEGRENISNCRDRSGNSDTADGEVQDFAVCDTTNENQGSSVVGNFDEQNRSTSGANEENTDKHCAFTQFSVRAENEGWRQFQMKLVSQELFDFIFADPVQSLSAQDLKQNQWTEFKDERRIREFANFCRVSLRPGCYVFVIVLAEEFSSFCSAFQAEGMKTMRAPFLIIPEAENVRMTRLKDLPQHCDEFAVVAKTPGTCFGFKPNFERSYSLFDCVFKRKIGVMDNVPRCQNPLRGARSKAEVRPRERHPDFVSEVLETFCSARGTVLDTFGGALTTAIVSRATVGESHEEDGEEKEGS